MGNEQAAHKGSHCDYTRSHDISPFLARCLPGKSLVRRTSR
jgi:hypothetical protein